MTYYERHLPHWHPEGSAIFLTWSLYGSLPRTGQVTIGSADSKSAERAFAGSAFGQYRQHERGHEDDAELHVEHSEPRCDHRQVIAMSTWNPARQIKRPDLGHLDVGAAADIAVLRIDKGNFGFIDSAGARNTGTENIVNELTLRNARVVFDLNGRASEDWRSFKHDRKKWKK